MTRKFILLIALCLSFTMTNITIAQDDAPQGEYEAQPKHAWEVGLHAGMAFATGDVDWKPGLGLGIHVRRAIDYVFSIRVQGTYDILYGFEQDEYRNPDANVSGTLSGLGYGNGNNWAANYKTTVITGSVQGVMSVNQFKFFKTKSKRWNPILFVGVGVSSFTVNTDALNGSAIYANGGAEPDEGALDGDYETELVLDSDDLGEGYLSPIVEVGVGLTYKINNRINIGLELQSKFIFGRADDFVDGHYQRTQFDETNNRDIINYGNLRLNFNLGNLDDKSEPLYWINPVDYMLNDIADLKARPKLDLTDTDGDGVIDMLDQEIDSPEGAPVDTRGVALDSDGDGLPDYKDKEIYSPIGYDIDGEGVAVIPAPEMIDEGDVNRIVDGKLKGFQPRAATTGISNWFLPMIHFDFNKSNIKRTEFEKIHHVATVMRQNPGVTIAVLGHTDKTSSNCYNNKLSYQRAANAIDFLVQNYGISRSRLILNWSGEESVLVPTDAQNYMNRRVEFKVADSESEMGMPDCSGPSPSGYSGNREAGY